MRYTWDTRETSHFSESISRQIRWLAQTKGINLLDVYVYICKLIVFIFESLIYLCQFFPFFPMKLLDFEHDIT